MPYTQLKIKQKFSINLSVLAPNHNIFAKKVTNSSFVYYFFQSVPKKETRDLKAYTKRNVFPYERMHISEFFEHDMVNGVHFKLSLSTERQGGFQLNVFH